MKLAARAWGSVGSSSLAVGVYVLRILYTASQVPGSISFSLPFNETVAEEELFPPTKNATKNPTTAKKATILTPNNIMVQRRLFLKDVRPVVSSSSCLRAAAITASVRTCSGTGNEWLLFILLLVSRAADSTEKGLGMKLMMMIEMIELTVRRCRFTSSSLHPSKRNCFFVQSSSNRKIEDPTFRRTYPSLQPSDRVNEYTFILTTIYRQSRFLNSTEIRITYYIFVLIKYVYYNKQKCRAIRAVESSTQKPKTQNNMVSPDNTDQIINELELSKLTIRLDSLWDDNRNRLSFLSLSLASYFLFSTAMVMPTQEPPPPQPQPQGASIQPYS